MGLVKRNSYAGPLAAIGIGAFATLGAVVATSMSAADGARLCALAVAVALVGGTAGAVVLRILRGRSVSAQLAVLSVTTVASLAGGAYIAARAMFISAHDLAVLVIVLLAAGTVSVGSALVLGARVSRASGRLIDVARRVGERTEPLSFSAESAPRELGLVAVELEAMERRLAESNARERALDSSRRELVAWVSHDLRTPLAGIRAIVEALEDGVVADSATVTRYYRTLSDEVDQLAALIDDLFELSRTNAGALRLHLEQVSLGDLVSDAIAGSAPVALAKGVRLEGRIVGPPPELIASAPEVLRALRNLLENAIRHTPTDGSVVVEAGVAHDEPESVYVSVHDTGGGIGTRDLARLFDVRNEAEFVRTPGSGTGLGLVIARGLVEAHRGTLTVRNDNGGARFTLRLPREPA